MSFLEALWEEAACIPQPAELLAARLFERLPEPCKIIPPLPMLGRQTAQQCRRIVAEWLFFLHCLEEELPAGAEEYYGIPIFPGLPHSLGELLHFSGAAAMAPITDSSVTRMIRLYAVRAAGLVDHKAALAAPAHPAWEECALFCSEAAAFDGESWQLAAALAARASTASPTEKQELGRAWIATGEVDHSGGVRAVKYVGAKLQLATKRRWFIPEKNTSSTSAFSGSLIGVRSVAEAWRWLQKGEIVSAEIRMEEPVQELHALVGKTKKTIAACALQLMPQKIHLWHSEETRPEAGELREFFTGLGFETDCRQMSSPRVEQLFELFAQCFENAGKNTVVSMTGGNRMMGFAALLAAYKSSQVKMVYRDKDDPPFALNVLSFHDRIQTDLCYLHRCSSLPQLEERICWDVLFATDRNAPDECTQFLKIREGK